MRNKNYTNLLAEIKVKIKEAQIKSVSAANSQMLLLYWKLGKAILVNQNKKGWGAKIIETLSKDLQKEFPTMKGFSPRNLKYMKKFSEMYSIETICVLIKIEKELKSNKVISQDKISKLLDEKIVQKRIVQQPVAQLQKSDIQKNTIVQQPVAQLEETVFLNSILSKISWSHHVVLMDKIEHSGKRLWYMLHTFENGISRNVLTLQIESKLFERQVKVKKINNFNKTLPPVQSDFVNYLLKDPYIFDFVQAKEKADERNIEEQLANQTTKFLLELGQGFAFVGRQVNFEVGGSDFYTDLLFYHTKLHAYIVVELKARPFEPGDASQMNFYVNLINDTMKSPTDQNTIGLLLCKGKNNVLAEYSLKGYSNAIGISDYQISKIIPDELKSSLPKIEEIEKELKSIKLK